MKEDQIISGDFWSTASRAYDGSSIVRVAVLGKQRHIQRCVAQAFAKLSTEVTDGVRALYVPGDDMTLH